MTRRRIKKTALSVALFPFLAVLVCTMGALIVLLVLVVQQARVDAAVVTKERDTGQQKGHDQKSQDDRAAREKKREDYLWRAEILEQQRSEKTTEMADQRLLLSHLEAHVRDIEQQWKRLAAEAKALEDAGDPSQQDHLAAQKHLDEMSIALAEARRKLDEAKRLNAERPRSYAVIPYDGPHGTRRKPLYVECRSDGILIQPEGIVLTPRDFLGPLGPGNPLAAVLRAKREYLARLGSQDEPYPLLIVRSDGIDAYGFARRAMKGWDDEFGYELIEADRPLSYPQPDPQLAEDLRKVVEVARHRQRVLAQAMPSRFRKEERDELVVTSGSGFKPAQGRRRPASGKSRGGRGFGSGGFANGPYGQASDSGGPGATSGGGSRGSQQGTFEPGQGAPTGARRPATLGHAETSATRPGGGDTSQPSTQGQSGREPASNAPHSDNTAALESPQNTAPGGGQGESGTGAGGAAGPNVGGGSPPAIQTPIAKSRGANFALPKYDSDLTELKRPIQVVCLPDRLIIRPERGVEAYTRTVMLRDEMRRDIDKFLTQVWARMDRWGLALPGGYWKPVLKVRVAPQSERRFQELLQLLNGSGLIVERTAK